MGQALYRKYRSKSLLEVVGQEHVTETLARAIKNSKTSHAYLFTGPRGVGKTSVARILAHELNNLPYDESSYHLDIIEIDAASNRRIDDIRDLRDKIHVAPVSASYKVYIIDEVHMLTGESFNALLKVLEEPPAHAVFILATTEIHKVPATIQSRTQRFHFRPVDVVKVTAHLRMIADAEGIAITDDALMIVAEHGEGSFRDSIGLLDQLGAMNDKKADPISEATVRGLVGTAPKNLIQDIVAAHKKGDRRIIQANISNALDKDGIHVSQLSKQLVGAFTEAAMTSPDLYAVVDKLLDGDKSGMPHVRLLVTLLSTAGNGSVQRSLDATPAPSSSQAQAPKYAQDKKEVEARSEPMSKPPVPKPIDKTSDPVVTVPPGANMFDDASWAVVISHVQSHNAPLFSVIKNAHASYSDGKLTLTFGFKLHQKKLDSGKFRTALIDSIGQSGFACPAIDALHDSNVTVTPFATVIGNSDTEDDVQAKSVLAMMS